MSEPKTIKITVKGGQAKVEASGYSGGECLKATKFLEKLLGPVQSQEKKSEFYEQQADSVQQEQ